MKQFIVHLALGCSLVAAVGCKKDGDKKPATAPTATAPGGAAPTAVAPTPAPAVPAAPEKMVEIDLSPGGDDFKGLVISVPESAKLNSDFQITWGESEYISVGLAPYWEDSIAGLSKDKDNQNIVISKGVMARYERVAPLGRSWLVDVFAKIGDKSYSCNNGTVGTFTSKAMADLAETMCKTLKKK